MVLVGKNAPDFSAPAVIDGGEMVDNFTLSQFRGKYVILFFYPKDFTFVCPTELHAFQAQLTEFEAKNTQIIAVSVDSENSHWAWLNTPKDKGGIQGVTYPLVADFSKTISKNYDVLAGDWDYMVDEVSGHDQMTFNGDPFAYRGLFLIDKEGIVRHQTVNFFPIGRSVAEAMRVLDAWRHFEDKGEVCPANWKEGDEAMTATHEGVSSYLAAH